MPTVATMKPYTLFVVDDDMPLNPRTDYDNLGKMVCWHSRYNLGDKHDYDEPRDFLQKKLFEMYSSYPSSQYGKPIYDFIKSGKAETAKLEYDRSAHEWVLYEKWFGGNEWSKSSSYPANLKGKEVPDWFLDDCLSALEHKELLQLLEQSGKFVILPLYLYDHSGITMNTTGFSCPWDSGQVGWIYVDADGIKKEYGKVTPETINKTRTVMNGEVETYDYYGGSGLAVFTNDNEWLLLSQHGTSTFTFEGRKINGPVSVGRYDNDKWVEESTVSPNGGTVTLSDKIIKSGAILRVTAEQLK